MVECTTPLSSCGDSDAEFGSGILWLPVEEESDIGEGLRILPADACFFFDSGIWEDVFFFTVCMDSTLWNLPSGPRVYND